MGKEQECPDIFPENKDDEKVPAVSNVSLITSRKEFLGFNRKTDQTYHIKPLFSCTIFDCHFKWNSRLFAEPCDS